MGTTLSLHRFAKPARMAVVFGQALADKRGHRDVTCLHLLAGVLRNDRCRAVVASSGADVDAVERRCMQALGELERAEGKAFLDRETIELLQRAQREAGDQQEVSVEHLLHALAQTRGPARAVFDAFELGPGAFRAAEGVRVDELDDDAEGAALLRDFASEVRGEHDDYDERQEQKRGLATLARIAKQLNGPDAIPNLQALNPSPDKLTLFRRNRDVEIVVSWEPQALALVTKLLKGDALVQTVRHVWNRHDRGWARVEGSGEFYRDLLAMVRSELFPEMRG